MTTTHHTTGPDTDAFSTVWQRWHRERVTAARAPYGLASVTGTHWLTTDPQSFAGAPGRWSRRDGTAIGIDLDVEAPVELAPGSSSRFGEVEVRALARDGAVGVRVLDPGSRARADLIDIDAYLPDAAWVLEGRFVPAEHGATIPVAHVDGADTVDPLAGWVEFSHNGVTHPLAAFPLAAGALQVSFGDATNGGETARFRFLSLPAPGPDGRVTVDFNRAYLPPSTFTDHYLCPLPPSGNRIDVAVRAGEKKPVNRADVD